jgi:hypothetical protein
MRRLLAVLIVGTLAAVVPMAHASPPDPTWIAGIWDAADCDEAILSLTGGDALPAVAVPVLLSLSLVLLGTALFPASAFAALRPRPAAANRAPPLA